MSTWKKKLRKIWWFIWEDDSVLSWVINIVLAFILIKYLVYPGLGFLLGTSFPVVAVVSGSMHHDGTFDDWWDATAYCSSGRCTQKEWYNEHGITKEQFTKFIFSNGFNKGDIIVLLGRPPDEIKVGDVIVFHSDKSIEVIPYPIIHRVVDRDETPIFQTKGDHNIGSDSGEMNITEQRLIGKAVFRIPLLGWIKIVFFDLLAKVGINIG